MDRLSGAIGLCYPQRGKRWAGGAEPWLARGPWALTLAFGPHERKRPGHRPGRGGLRCGPSSHRYGAHASPGRAPQREGV